VAGCGAAAVDSGSLDQVDQVLGAGEGGSTAFDDGARGRRAEQLAVLGRSFELPPGERRESFAAVAPS
jgi:hypothetical protein